jgi:hypothetical protein
MNSRILASGVDPGGRVNAMLRSSKRRGMNASEWQEVYIAAEPLVRLDSDIGCRGVGIGKRGKSGS